jgi:hypothetical protein
MATRCRAETVPRALYNTPTLAYRNDDGFAVLAERRMAQDLALGSS